MKGAGTEEGEPHLEGTECFWRWALAGQGQDSDAQGSAARAHRPAGRQECSVGPQGWLNRHGPSAQEQKRSAWPLSPLKEKQERT